MTTWREATGRLYPARILTVADYLHRLARRRLAELAPAPPSGLDDDGRLAGGPSGGAASRYFADALQPLRRSESPACRRRCAGSYCSSRFPAERRYQPSLHCRSESQQAGRRTSHVPTPAVAGIGHAHADRASVRATMPVLAAAGPSLRLAPAPLETARGPIAACAQTSVAPTESEPAPVEPLAGAVGAAVDRAALAAASLGTGLCCQSAWLRRVPLLPSRCSAVSQYPNRLASTAAL